MRLECFSVSQRLYFIIHFDLRISSERGNVYPVRKEPSWRNFLFSGGQGMTEWGVVFLIFSGA